MNKIAILIIIFTFTKSCNSIFNGRTQKNVIRNRSEDEDAKLDFLQLSAKYGFPNVEAINVITEDGYILTLHHIQGDPRRPVLLAHGNTADSICWVLRGRISVGITLAARGYDVWAINFRGTVKSRRHINLNPDKQPAQFFNYTFYEQGVYDLPATIDYILEATNQTQLLAIGHSIGTTDFYVLGSERPEYNDKIKVFISLAPISFVQYGQGVAAIFRIMGDIAFPLSTAVGSLLGQFEVLSPRKPVEKFLDALCSGPLGYKVCIEKLMFPVFGPDVKGFEPGFVRTFFGHYPDSCSIKLFEHITQLVHRNKFARYDYGEIGNMAEYGAAEPPEFDLSKASMKMALFVGSKDYLATVPDAERLSRALPNVVHYQVLPYESFNHVDFVWGRNMPTDLFPYLLPVVEKYID